MEETNCPTSTSQEPISTDPEPITLHQCDRCPASFRSAGLLARHVGRLHSQKRYNCGHCGAGFNSPKNFSLHRAIHAPKPFKCPKCSVVFRRHATLVGHIERYYASEDHTCAVCDREFGSLEELKAHVYEGHEEGNRRQVGKINVVQGFVKKLHECKFCDKTFPKKSLLERHYLVHTKQKPFKCEVCSKCFNQKSTLKTHILTHNGVQDFRCLLCGLKFSQKINLRVHTFRMHPKRTASVADRLPCPYCPCLFKKLGSLNAHKAKVHAALLPDPTTVEEPPVDCPVESVPEVVQVFEDLVEMSRNVVACDSLEPEVVQPVIACRTQHHLEGKSEDRQHACTICPAAFKKSSHLTQHTRSHYGIKSYRCEICNKTFTTNRSLKIHRISHGSTVPDFRCDQCPASFNLQSSLRRHAAIHENPDRSYSCPLCKRVFKWFQNCKAHIRTSHGKEGAPESLITAEQSTKLEATQEPHDATLLDLNNLPPNVQIYDINSLTNCLVRINDQFYELPVQIDTDQLTQEQHIVEIVQEVSTEQMYILPDSEIIQEEVLDQSDTPEPPADPKPNPKDKKLPNVTEQDLFSEGLVNGKKCYSCKACQKPFKKPIDLRRHIRTHTGDRPFMCDRCPKSFTLKAVLLEHQKTHQERREVLFCTEPQCEAKFSSKAALEMHRRIHTGQRPFRCTVCTLTFRTSGHMQAHMVSHERLAAKREQNLLQFGA
uniref:Zinc finger protein 729 n=1 Tax=Culex pipiens TaxID=7175 RepID=A0A8D8JH88_CULPI